MVYTPEQQEQFLNYEQIGSDATLFEAGDGLDLKKANPTLLTAAQGHALGQAAIAEQPRAYEKTANERMPEYIGQLGAAVVRMRQSELGLTA